MALCGLEEGDCQWYDRQTLGLQWIILAMCCTSLYSTGSIILHAIFKISKGVTDIYVNIPDFSCAEF